MLEIDLNVDDDKLRQILEKFRVVAIVGNRTTSTCSGARSTWTRS